MRIELKSVIKDSSDNWALTNPILASGVVIYEEDTNKIKICNGELSYSELPYVGGVGGGESGTTDYSALSNKPKIANIELNGNKTLDQLGIQAKGNYALSSELESKADKSELDSKANQTELQSLDYRLESVEQTLDDLDETLEPYAKSSDLNNYATKSELNSKADSSSLNNYATKAELSPITSKLAEYLPEPPSEEGNYYLRCVVADGGVYTFTWASENGLTA